MSFLTAVCNPVSSAEKGLSGGGINRRLVRLGVGKVEISGEKDSCVLVVYFPWPYFVWLELVTVLVERCCLSQR